MGENVVMKTGGLCPLFIVVSLETWESGCYRGGLSMQVKLFTIEPFGTQ